MAMPNSLFALFHVGKPEVVESKLHTIAPWLYLAIDPSVWILAAPSGTTTKEVCEKLDIETGQSTGIVVRFDSYFGVSSPSVWEWIAEKRGAVLVATTSST
jgi:hypothetical protein